MYSHVACDVIKEQTLYLLKPSSLIWHLMPYLFLFIINDYLRRNNMVVMMEGDMCSMVTTSFINLTTV